MTPTYVVGDATRPVGYGVKYICHVCNDIDATLMSKLPVPVYVYDLPGQPFRESR